VPNRQWSVGLRRAPFVRRANDRVVQRDDVTGADEPAFREGNQVWGRVVADIPDFNRELVKALIAELPVIEA